MGEIRTEREGRVYLERIREKREREDWETDVLYTRRKKLGGGGRKDKE